MILFGSQVLIVERIVALGSFFLGGKLIFVLLSFWFLRRFDDFLFPRFLEPFSWGTVWEMDFSVSCGNRLVSGFQKVGFVKSFMTGFLGEERVVLLEFD